MKFSNEAMRDVLLFIEENQKYYRYEEQKRLTTYNIDMIIGDTYFRKLFSKYKYSEDELRYTIGKLIDGGILKIKGSLDTFYQITEISFKGIQLLEVIRPENVWEKTKSIAGKFGNYTLVFIEKIAHDIAIETSKEGIKVAMWKNS